MIEAYLTPTFHPAAVLRDMRKQHAVVEDLKKAVRIHRDGGPTLIPKAEREGGKMPLWATHPARRDVEGWFESHRHQRLAVDFEATLRRKIYCVAFWPVDDWLETQGICVPIRSKGGALYWEKQDSLEILCIMEEVFTSPAWPIIGQNYVGYDGPLVKEKWGFDTNGFDQDTMVAHHLCYPELAHSLAYQSSMVTDLGAYKLEVKEREKAEDDEDEDDSVKGIENVAEIDDTRLRTYCLRDTFATAGAALHLERLMT